MNTVKTAEAVSAVLPINGLTNGDLLPNGLWDLCQLVKVQFEESQAVKVS